MSLLGKRMWSGYLGKRSRQYVGRFGSITPYARTGTRYRSLRRVGRRRGPFRTGGFYGASVRSPVEKLVIDTAEANYDVDTTGDIVLINGEWIA